MIGKIHGAFLACARRVLCKYLQKYTNGQTYFGYSLFKECKLLFMVLYETFWAGFNTCVAHLCLFLNRFFCRNACGIRTFALVI